MGPINTFGLGGGGSATSPALAAQTSPTYGPLSFVFFGEFNGSQFNQPMPAYQGPTQFIALVTPLYSEADPYEALVTPI